MSQKCPICGSELQGGDYYSYDTHCLEEASWLCPRKHYGREYSYGSGRTSVGDLEVYDSWTDSDEQRKEERALIEAEVACMKCPWYHAIWRIRYEWRTRLWIPVLLWWSMHSPFRKEDHFSFK